MKLKADSYLKAKNLRSANFILEVWDLISTYLYQEFGLRNYIKFNCIFDRDEISLSVYDYNNRCVNSLENDKITFKNLTYLKTDLAFDLNIVLIKSEMYSLDIDDCNYYFTYDDSKIYSYDDGTIFLLCKSTLNFKHFDLFRKDLVLLLVKEMQYALHKIFFAENLRDNINIELDAKIEQLIILSKIDNIDFKTSFEKYKKKIDISLSEEKIIKNLNYKNLIV